MSLTEYDHDDEQKLERLVQSTRWNEVADARKRVLNRLEAIDRLQFEGHHGLDRDRVSVLLMRTVQLYVQQVETILDPVGSSQATKWWDSKEVGQFELPNGREIVVSGLKEYLELDEEIEYAVREHHKPHAAHVGEIRQVEKTAAPPVGIHRMAFRNTNRGLAEQGVDFDTHDRDVGEEDIDKSNSV